LGITSILARENGQGFINCWFAGTVPGLSTTTSMERLLHLNLDLVFISGGPSFVRQKCSFCRDLSIVATSHAQGNRLVELSLTTLVWTYVEHSEVGEKISSSQLHKVFSTAFLVPVIVVGAVALLLLLTSWQWIGLHQIPEICPTEKGCGSSNFGEKYNDQS
jgi:hypothetical protein